MDKKSIKAKSKLSQNNGKSSERKKLLDKLDFETRYVDKSYMYKGKCPETNQEDFLIHKKIHRKYNIYSDLHIKNCNYKNLDNDDGHSTKCPFHGDNWEANLILKHYNSMFDYQRKVHKQLLLDKKQISTKTPSKYSIIKENLEEDNSESQNKLTRNPVQTIPKNPQIPCKKDINNKQEISQNLRKKFKDVIDMYPIKKRNRSCSSAIDKKRQKLLFRGNLNDDWNMSHIRYSMEKREKALVTKKRKREMRSPYRLENK